MKRNNTRNVQTITKNTSCPSWFFVSFVFLISTNLNSQLTEKKYLSGTGNDNTVNWEFFCTAGMNSGKWTTIPVPSCWELQGFGKYDYGFARDSVRGKEKGLYKYSFTIPNTWKNKKINIVFEGSMTDTEVKINGQSAGETHQGAFYAFRYDISGLVKFGESNLLEVTVAKHSANPSVNAAERSADFWIFGGIFRPVWLEALPEQHIENISIDAKANGSFKAEVYFKGNIVPDLKLQLFSSDGKKLNVSNYKVTKINPATIRVTGNTISPKPWTPESPDLYKAEFTLMSRAVPVHKVQKTFGFRTVEVKERDGIYVNGVKVKMKGVNRHSFWPTSGRTTSKKISIDDVLLMKDMNMNAVRMSHYPPDDHFLDACDSLGLFVMDELAGWHGNYNTETGTKLVKEMLTHDVNHPSIIFWANGNEGGHNFDLDTLFKEYDIQKRPVLHPWQLFGGFETQHYREYDYGIGNYDHGHDIIMPTEFLNGNYDGGHGAGLEDYWEAMWRKPLSAGGFLWDFADQGVVRRDKKDSVDTDKNRGADGIIGPYHEKEGSYYTIKEVWSPVYFEEKEITTAFDGTLNIKNRYHFTNINECKFSYQLKSWGVGATEQTGSIPAPSIRPMEKGILKISLPTGWKTYNVLYVTVRDKFNREIVTKSFPLVQPTHFTSLLSKDEGAMPVLTQSDSLFVIKADEVQVSIHKRTGLLIEVKSGNGIIPFNKGPVIEQGVNNFQGFTAKQEGKNIVISSVYDKRSSYNTMQWTVYPAGMVKLQVTYFPGEYFTSMIGVNFYFPENKMKAIEYMGYGPYRVWKNRIKGNKFGVWKKTYNNTETGEFPWLYPEFKGYHANMYWCRFTMTDNQTFYVATETNDVFLRLFTPAWRTDQWKNYEPIFPSGDISFMQGIPGIGSKTQRNETTGPMGMKNSFYDYEKDPVRALKLVLYFYFK
ncbi:MAG: glycoside hydrolase family 2 TIM barrel-domain containing protein [Chitinophagaceae bacterium]